MFLAGLKANDEFDPDDAIFQNLKKGLDYAWDKPAMVIMLYSKCCGYSDSEGLDVLIVS